MKIRNGFVSNSSTTSFAIIGLYVDDYDIENQHESIKQLKEKVIPKGQDVWELYKDKHWGGWTDLGDGLAGYGWDTDISYIGIDALENWKNGMSYKEALETIRELIKEKYDIAIPEDQFGVFHGEAGNG